MTKKLFLLAASLLFPVLAAAQSSTQVPITPDHQPAVTNNSVFGKDSRRNAPTAGAEAPSAVSTFGSNEYCPEGTIWGEPYGVLYCLSLQQRCDAAYLSWASADGKSLCKGYAPASSAIKIKPLIKYKGVIVDACPEGASRTDCVETTQQVFSSPISLDANPQISVGVGTAAASCISGAWSIGTSTCNGGTSTALKPCSATTVAWTSGSYSCSASAPSGTAGQSISLTDSVGPQTGSTNAICIDGAWGGLTGQKCSTKIPDCPSTTKTWGNYCSGSLPQTPNGGTGSASDSSGLYLGSAQYSCVNGSWSANPSSQSCNVHCSSQGGSWQWQKGTAVCNGYLPVTRTPAGGTLTVTDNSRSGSDLATGTYSVTCKADGTWDQANQSINCTSYCPSYGGLEAWNVNGNVCSGYMPSSPVAPGTYTIQNNSWEMTTGSFTATCNSDGVWNTSSFAKTCVPPCPAIYNHQWWVGSSACMANATVPSTKAGGWLTAYDTTAPSTGSDTTQCLSNGTWNKTSASKSCVTQNCPAATGEFLTNCYGSIPSTPPGSSATAINTRSGFTGSGTFTCKADGQWAWSGGSCNSQ